MIDAIPACRYCERKRPLRHRGLCAVCFGDDAILALFPFVAPNEILPGGQQDFHGSARPSSASTATNPGTIDKILVMMERVRLGQELHHADDVRLGDGSPMLLSLANIMQARDAQSRVNRGEQKQQKSRCRVGRIKQPPWRLYPCCLFGAVTRGKCDCEQPACKRVFIVAPAWVKLATAFVVHRIRREKRTATERSLFDERRHALPLAG